MPTANPSIASKELERAVTKLGLKGSLINGHVRGEFLDNRKYWVIFECAQALNVPIHLHPTLPHGLPSGHARRLNALDLQPNDRVPHCGCGTGYYMAIIAHVFGNSGHATAIELQQSLASRAEKNLRHLSHVEVIAGNATTYGAGKVNAIYVNAGATYPMPL